MPCRQNSPTPLRSDPKESSYEELKQRIHSKLVDKLDLSRVSELEGDTLRREIRLVVEHLCDTEDTLLNRNERERNWSAKCSTRRSALVPWRCC